jgi:hypothetical protein
MEPILGAGRQVEFARIITALITHEKCVSVR